MPKVRSNPNWGDIQSQTINLLRFPLIIAIIFIHSKHVPTIIDYVNWNGFSGIDIYNLIRYTCSYVIADLAVPTFFAISGFLFFRNFQKWDIHLYKTKIISRLKSLAIPYFLWNIILLTLLMAGIIYGAHSSQLNIWQKIVEFFNQNGWMNIFWSCSKWNPDYIAWLNVTGYSTGPIDVPLWFLRDLIVLSILTPLLFIIIKKVGLYFILLLGFLFIADIFPEIPGLTMASVFFFSAGAYFAIKGRNMVSSIYSIRNPVLGITTILFVLDIIIMSTKSFSDTSYAEYHHSIYVIFGMMSLFIIGAKLIQGNKFSVNHNISKGSFFVFLSHNIVILPLSTIIITSIIPWVHPWALTLQYLLIPILTASISLVIYFIMLRFTPKFLAILTGSR